MYEYVEIQMIFISTLANEIKSIQNIIKQLNQYVANLFFINMRKKCCAQRKSYCFSLSNLTITVNVVNATNAYIMDENLRKMMITRT